MAKKKILLMEHVWIGVALITLAVFIYTTIKQGFGKSYLMLIFSAISILMYLWRRKLRNSENDE